MVLSVSINHPKKRRDGIVVANQLIHAVYHIHETIAWSGNCTAALAHLDPYDRGETPACDASKPETCQVGDLSGKHGKITSDPFVAEYIDLYASINYTDPAYVGNRSIVVHYANKTRLTCADFGSFYGFPASVPTASHTTASSRTATTAPIATGANNIFGSHNSTISGNVTGSHTKNPHNFTTVLSATGVLTSTSVVTALDGLTTAESFTAASTSDGVSASATSSITPSPGAAAGNQISISLLVGVVVIMLLSL